MDKKYTQEGLPIVTEETYTAFMDEIGRDILMNDGVENTLESWLKEIERENSEVLKYIGGARSVFPDCLGDRAVLFITGLYFLMKSQENNYKIQEIFQSQNQAKNL